MTIPQQLSDFIKEYEKINVLIGALRTEISILKKDKPEHYKPLHDKMVELQRQINKKDYIIFLQRQQLEALGVDVDMSELNKYELIDFD